MMIMKMKAYGAATPASIYLNNVISNGIIENINNNALI